WGFGRRAPAQPRWWLEIDPAISAFEPSAARRLACYGRLLGSLKPILKCSAQSIQQIQCRPTALQEPPNRIRANAENPKASHSSLFERAVLNLLIKTYRTPVSGVFRPQSFWFRGLWQKPGQRFLLCGGNPARRILCLRRPLCWRRPLSVGTYPPVMA